MGRNLRMREQKYAIDELGRLMHMRREQIALLITKEDNPLPIPPKYTPDDFYVIDTHYLQQLRHWVVDEKQDKARNGEDTEPFVLAEREISDWLKSFSSVGDWSVDDELDRYPPGYFLG